MRVGFSWCSGLKSPCGSHQASAMALNLATSVLSTVLTEGSGAVCDRHLKKCPNLAEIRRWRGVPALASLGSFEYG